MTETGRQPYTVYGLLRTDQSLSPVGTAAVAGSLTAIAILYVLILGAGLIFIFRLIAKPPEQDEPGVPNIPQRAAGITPGPPEVLRHSPTQAE